MNTFPVHPSFMVDFISTVKSVSSTHEINETDLLECFSIQNLCSLQERYQQTPPEMFPFAYAGCDGVHYGYISHFSDDSNFKIGEFCPMDSDGVLFRGDDIKSALESILYFNHDQNLLPKSKPTLKALKDLCNALSIDYKRGKLVKIYDNDGNAFKLEFRIPDGFTFISTSDGIGVIAMKKDFSGDELLQNISIDEMRVLANKNRTDHPATSLFFLKQIFWDFWTQNDNAIALLHELKNVYLSLNRPHLAYACECKINDFYELSKKFES